jgi:hypothetical protein
MAYVATSLAVAAVAWFAFADHRERDVGGTVAVQPASPAVMRKVSETTTAAPSSGTVGMAAGDPTTDGIDLARRVDATVGSLKAVLPGITDAASAQAALTKIGEATTQLGDVASLAAKLSPEQRGLLARAAASLRPSVDDMCEKVLATDAGPTAKPAVDDLRARLDALTRT